MIAPLLFAGWTVAGLIVWWQAFPLDPVRWLAALRQGILGGAFDPVVLFETWGEALTTWMLLAGVLSLAARAGGEGRAWLRIRRGAGDGTPLRIALGLGVGGLGLLGAGLTGLLFAPPPWAVYAVLGTAGGAGLGTWAFGRKERRRLAVPDPGPAPEAPTMIAIGMAVVVAAAGVFGPETGWDAMMYHLRLPSFWEARHAMRDTPHDFYATYPHLAEAVYAGCRVAGGDALARWLEAALAVVLALSAGDLARRLGGSPRLAMGVVVGSPVVLALVPRAYNDLQLALFGSLAMSLAARNAWTAAGAVAGFALGTKYVGVLIVPAMLAVALARGTGHRTLLRWGGAAAVVAGPWYLRNLLWRGNPVEPFLAGVFGTAATLPDAVVPFFQRAGGVAALLGDLPRRAGALLLDPGHLQSPLSPAVFLWLPLAFLPGGSGGGFPAAIRAGALGWLAGWLVLAPDARFALATVPVLAGLAAAGAARWVAVVPDAALPRAGGLLRRAGLALPLIAGALHAASRELIAIDPLAMPLGRASGAQRLARGLVPAPFAHLAVKAVRERVPRNGRVLVVSHFITYHMDRECLADWHTGRSHLVRLLAGARDPAAIDRAFRRAGVGWLLFAGPGCLSYLGIPGYYDSPPETWMAFRAFLATRSLAVWQTDGYALLQLDAVNRLAAGVPYLPGRETAGFAAADRALADGDAVGALAAYRSAPPVLEGVGSTHLRRGEALIALRRLPEADTELARALAMGLDTPRLHERRAFVMLGLGRLRDARFEIARAAAMLPGSVEIESTRRAVEAAVSRSGLIELF